MKLEDIFTADELALIDSGEYKPGRAVLDAKLDLVAAIEREACAEMCKKHADVYGAFEPTPSFQAAWAACIDLRDQIRARGEA